MFYFSRVTKDGAELITAYKDMASAKRFYTQESASTSKKIWEGESYFNLTSGKYGPTASGVGLLSYMKGSNAGTGGRFAVFSKIDDQPNDLGLRFDTYGNANKFMKAVVNSYGELWVLEMEKIGKGSKSVETADDEVQITEEAPF